MLSQYVPDDYVGSDRAYICEVYLNAHSKRIVNRGRLNQLAARYYAIQTTTGDIENVLAGTTITDEIDYATLPPDHLYQRSHNASGHHPDDWPLIRYYAQKRGILLHHYILHDDVPLEERAEHLLATTPDGTTAEDVQEAVGKWRHAPHVPLPSEDHAHDDCQRALAEYADMEARKAARNWQEIADTLDTRWIADETKVLGETPDGHVYGGQIDRLTAVENESIPPGVYVLDLKLAADWHPRHLVQAESYRRALADDFPGIDAAVVRLGVEDGESEIITSHDDEWDAEELWSLFSRRADSLYNDSLYKVALANSGR